MKKRNKKFRCWFRFIKSSDKDQLGLHMGETDSLSIFAHESKTSCGHAVCSFCLLCIPRLLLPTDVGTGSKRDSLILLLPVHKHIHTGDLHFTLSVKMHLSLETTRAILYLSALYAQCFTNKLTQQVLVFLLIFLCVCVFFTYIKKENISLRI